MLSYAESSPKRIPDRAVVVDHDYVSHQASSAVERAAARGCSGVMTVRGINDWSRMRGDAVGAQRFRIVIPMHVCVSVTSRRAGRLAIVRVTETCGELERETTVRFRHRNGQWVCQGGRRTHRNDNGQYHSKVRLTGLEAQSNLDRIVAQTRSRILTDLGADPAEVLAGVDCAHPMFLSGVRAT